MLGERKGEGLKNIRSLRKTVSQKLFLILLLVTIFGRSQSEVLPRESSGE